MTQSTNTDKPFETGEEIIWSDEVYTVVHNYGSQGVVIAPGGEKIGGFHWDAYGETAVRKS